MSMQPRGGCVKARDCGLPRSAGEAEDDGERSFGPRPQLADQLLAAALHEVAQDENDGSRTPEAARVAEMDATLRRRLGDELFAEHVGDGALLSLEDAVPQAKQSLAAGA